LHGTKKLSDIFLEHVQCRLQACPYNAHAELVPRCFLRFSPLQR
jgi:hypothetical protein